MTMRYHSDRIRCQQCNEFFYRKPMGPRRPKYCKNACRQAAYRQGKDDARKPSVTSIDDTRNRTSPSGD